MKKEIKKTIKIPEQIEIKIEIPKIIITGPKGAVEKTFKFKDIIIKKENNNIIVLHEKASKKDKKLVNTIAAHILSMIKGVIDGYEYELQVCSTHFPTSVKLDKEKNILIIKNFLGENKDRTVKIRKGVEVKVEGDKIKINSVDKELAGQQAADIETISRIRNKDRRVFQDGVWIIKKEKGKKLKNEK